MKKLLPYAIALMVGVALWVLVTPFAKAHRTDKSLIGGEMLMPVFTVAGVAVVSLTRKESGK